MYRVGIVINENEASHSKYADSEATLRLAINHCNKNGLNGNSYHFTIYDKFTIDRLFDLRESDISTLNALVIATNALSFGEKIYFTFCENRKRIEEFLNKRKGIFISSQKKLSNGNLSTDECRSVEFLPEGYNYYLYDRPEKSSADGKVSISASSVLLEYPCKITNELIDHRCNDNQFMAHKYRTLIIPDRSSSYQTLLSDEESGRISQSALAYNGARNLLLYSEGTRRIVISTMALDWASHVELLSNILTFIAETEPRIFFVKKACEQPKSAIVDSYIIRANIANIPYREVSEDEMHNGVSLPGNSFIFSPLWSSEEIEKVYSEMLLLRKDYFTIHHICHTSITADKKHKLVKYRNYSSIDLLKDAVIRSLLCSFQSTKWGKSVWTYSYIVKLLAFYQVKQAKIAKELYRETSLHFTKVESGKRILTGDYDGVFNATCKMLEVLNILSQMYGDSFKEDIVYGLNDVINSAETWVLERFNAGAVFDQDICYLLLYLTRVGSFITLDKSVKLSLVNAFEVLLTKIAEEVWSHKVHDRSSADLCRVYQTLCILTVENMLAVDKAVNYLTQIETTLRDRQDSYGNWKQISETAEITLTLLESHPARAKIGYEMNAINTLIAKGIEALHSQYDIETNMWASDISTTAKAMNAIALYDKIFNFSINDFLSDFKLHREYVTGNADDLTIERIGFFYNAIDRLEKDKELVSRKLKESEIKLSHVHKNAINTKFALALTIEMLVGLAFFLGLFVLVLYVKHKNTLLEIFSDWQNVLADGIIALICALAATRIAQWIKSKVKE
jgi:hypothetical protein